MTTAAKPAPFGPDLRSALVAMVRKRVPESEVEDIVQSALAEAIASPHAPADSESLRRWIFGVAKNKVVDYHRRAGRESFDLPDVPGAPAPHLEADLLRWAEKNLPEGDENQKTLDWMIREGDGEKLESIAESEKLPPPRVRQRVSRLRRHFRENWQREVAMLAALGVIITAVVFYVTRQPDAERITHEVVDPRAEPVRRLALEKCAAADWKSCVDGLDDAKRLDPAGDTRPDVQNARKAATDAQKAPAPLDMTPPPIPSAAPLPTTAPPSRAAPILPKTPPSPDSAPAPTTAAPPPPTKMAPGKPTSMKASGMDDSEFGSLDSASGGSDTKATVPTPVTASKFAGGSGKKPSPSPIKGQK